MSAPPEPEPAELTPLLAASDPGRISEPERDREAGEPGLTDAVHAGSGPLSAAAVVERLRLWKLQPSAASERPFLMLNMACTADGRATLGGRSGPIGNRADRELFHALRTAVDAVLVGAGTVRAEHYRGLVRDADARRLRSARGLSAEPLTCIVSGSLTLPAAEVPLLSDPAARVAILTPSSATLPASAATVEYVRCTRAGSLDLPGALRELRRRLGVRTVLCEGGPHLNAELLAAGLVDELWLSLAPKLAGGGETRGQAGGRGTEGAADPLRIVSGPELAPPVELELITALESQSQLLLRYRVAGGASRS
jgi:riboflavin-specific deaminase-like protein